MARDFAISKHNIIVGTSTDCHNCTHGESCGPSGSTNTCCLIDPAPIDPDLAAALNLFHSLLFATFASPSHTGCLFLAWAERNSPR